MRTKKAFGQGALWLCGLLLAIAVLMVPFPAGAVTRNWTTTSGDWSDAAAWDPPGQPQNGDDVRLLANTDYDLGINYTNTVYPSAHHPTLFIDNTGSGRVTLGLYYDPLLNPFYPLSADSAEVGRQGRGEIWQISGAANFQYLDLGLLSRSQGLYRLESGNLNVALETIGVAGTGRFEQSGGSHSYTFLILGNSAGGAGRYTLSGGTLSGAAATVGVHGSGTFVQTGGQHFLTTLGGWLYVTRGSYELQGGELQAKAERVGVGARGEFNHSGGTNYLWDSLVIGQSGGVGTYNLSGGRLSSLQLTVGNDNDSQGLFRQTGGEAQVSLTLSLGKNEGSLGVYRLQDGTLATEFLYVGDRGEGRFVQRGGTIYAEEELIVGHERGGRGTWEMSGGSLISYNFTIVGDKGEGSFTHSGGRHSISHALTVGRANPGSYALSGTGELETQTEYIGYGAAGTFTQTGGSNRVTTDLWVGGPQLLDILAPGRGIYSLSGGTLEAEAITVGRDGQGDFSQSGGEVSAGRVFLGRETGGEGTYNLSAGTLTASYEMVGNSGRGTFTHTGGFHTLGLALFVGYEAGSTGTYELRGTGDLRAGNEEIGFRGQGNFSQRGGTNVITNDLILGGQDGSRGVYRLVDGSLRADQELIGLNGYGAFIQSGGRNQTGTLCLAKFSTARGEYHLRGGLLNSASLDVGRRGVFTQSGGTFDTGPLTNAGEVNLQGGTATVRGDIHNQTTGRLNISHDVTFPGNATNDGTIKTTGATVTWGGTFTNNGAYISDPSKQTFNNLVVGKSGYLTGYSQDLFIIMGDLEVRSTQNQLWQTDQAVLQFFSFQSDELTPSNPHNFWLAGADLGPGGGGRNFRWGTLMVQGVTVNLLDGNPQNQGTALYLGEIQGLDIDWSTLTVLNLCGLAGMNVYYDPFLNPELEGKIFSLYGPNNQLGGHLMPTPLPASVLLLGSGLLGLYLLGWRR